MATGKVTDRHITEIVCKKHIFTTLAMEMRGDKNAKYKQQATYVVFDHLFFVELPKTQAKSLVVMLVQDRYKFVRRTEGENFGMVG